MITVLALAVGVVGGIYGIGGGSLLGPILVGRGHPVVQVAPAVLTSTFVISVVGAATFTVLGLTTTGDIVPDWQLGLLCGLGGLIGGYLGARLQPRLPETRTACPPRCPCHLPRAALHRAGSRQLGAQSHHR